MSEGLQLSENLSEETGITVNSQHTGAESVNNLETAVPEPILVILHKEWFQRVADFIAHVGVGQVETGKNGGLQVVFSDGVFVDKMSDEHVDKHHIGRVDECDILPTLQQ